MPPGFLPFWMMALMAILAPGKGIIVWHERLEPETNATSLLQEWTTPFAKDNSLVVPELPSNGTKEDNTTETSWGAGSGSSGASMSPLQGSELVTSAVSLTRTSKSPEEHWTSVAHESEASARNSSDFEGGLNVTKLVHYVIEGLAEDSSSSLEDMVMLGDGSDPLDGGDPETDTHPSHDHPGEVRSSSSIHVYIIGIVGIVPAAGALAWCLRRFWTKSNKNLDTLDLPLSIPGSCQLGPPLYRLDESESSRYSSSSKRLHHKDPSDESGKDIDICYIHPRNSYFPLEFPRSQLQLFEVLGEGNFGQVWKGRAFYFGHTAQPIVVAVKTVKANSSGKDKQDLLHEVEIMHQLGCHPNVVQLIGCCTEQEPYLIIMEYVMFGKLLTYLRDHRSRRDYYNYSTSGISSADLTLFSYQVAKGMEYISAHGVIHRDLAARNILVDHNKVCKVADFGLSRNVREQSGDAYEQKSKGALPIRWMAPESLYMNIFTSKSDVWAFGILLWEIVTLGSTPYPGMGAREVIRGVRDGYVMACPEHCRPELYTIMRQCWAMDPNVRPNFTQLRASLGRLLEMQTGYIDLEHFPEHAYYNIYHSSGEKV